MNIPFTSVIYADGSWTYTWAPALGLVRVVLCGELLTTTTDNAYTYTSELFISDTDAPPIEVVLDGEQAVSERNLCFLVLQWYRVGCVLYEIECKVGTTWRPFGSVQDDPLIGVQTFVTPVLPDQADAEWRVTAVDENKREGEPLEYEWLVVRPPDPPTGVTLECSGGTLTVN